MRFTGVAATLLMYHSTVLQHCEGSVRYRKGYTSVQADSDNSDREESGHAGATPSSGDAPKLRKTTAVIKPFAPQILELGTSKLEDPLHTEDFDHLKEATSNNRVYWINEATE
ncbi:hypothetical protein FOZ62_017557 [Perkinsus olseni]|uniref:Uncharacterized protein n=1 Tax=Perkinsus olseni TaxID=32597 RepID=A0A7J6NMA4_PEROL|nr:hypothetical protein FOZ62_017557 [Perkinsus olseni]